MKSCQFTNAVHKSNTLRNNRKSNYNFFNYCVNKWCNSLLFFVDLHKKWAALYGKFKGLTNMQHTLQQAQFQAPGTLTQLTISINTVSPMFPRYFSSAYCVGCPLFYWHRLYVLCTLRHFSFMNVMVYCQLPLSVDVAEQLQRYCLVTCGCRRNLQMELGNILQQ